MDPTSPSISETPRPATPAPGPIPEDEYQSVCQVLLTPEKGSWGPLLFIGTLLGFAFLATPGANGAASVALLVAALLVHELGHLAAMWLFGYRDLKVFFIPFFGAAASGHAVGVAAWKQAIVLLAGPLPGLGIGLFCLLLAGHAPTALPHQAAFTLLSLNLFNLLPLAFLDGGQLFNVLFFSGRPGGEAVFRAITLILLGLISLYLEAWLLAIVCLSMLMRLPAGYRLAKAAMRLTPLLGTERCEVVELADEKRRALFAAARPLVVSEDPVRLLAAQMRQVYDRATTSRAPVLQALAFGALWAGSVFGTVVAVVLIGALFGH